MHQEITSYINKAYKKRKHPTGLIAKIEARFPAVRSIVIDMQQLDVLKFTIQAHVPLCLINDLYVISHTYKCFKKDIFDEKILMQVPRLEYQGPLHKKNIIQIAQFYESVEPCIIKDFHICIVDLHTIWFHSKYDQNLSLLANYRTVPSLLDIVECKKLYEQARQQPYKDKRAKVCNAQSGWVCDIRFDRQIVLSAKEKRG
jgi:hypothetical protein